MAHRGRLNMLAHVMAKPYRAIFHEFEGGSATPDDVEGSGDVKYHLGASSDREFDGNKVHLSLTANPSHLGDRRSGRARQGAREAGSARRSAGRRASVLPLLIHGDAAFAGQGVVAECFALSGLKGYRTGGTIHFIVNNQIGFTTAPRYARSSPYPSDVAMMVQAPIFHVNGDDPEAVVHLRAHRDRIPPDVPQGRRHRHVLLSPLRPQRRRRAVLHAALDVRRSRIIRRRCSSTARSWSPKASLTQGEVEAHAAPSWRSHLEGEFEVGQELPPEQGRLARRPLDGLARSRTRSTIRAAAPPASPMRR